MRYDGSADDDKHQNQPRQYGGGRRAQAEPERRNRRSCDQKRVEVEVAGDLKGYRTVLGAGTDLIKSLEAVNLEAKIRQAESVQTKAHKMKELASPERHEDIEKHILSDVTKQEERTEEVSRLQEGNPDLGECRIKIHKNVHPGVHV